MQYRSLLWLLSLALLLNACDITRLAPAPDAGSDVTFTVLQFNDVYEISPLEGGKTGGLARVATVKKVPLASR